jgi:hypothetical protein
MRIALITALALALAPAVLNAQTPAGMADDQLDSSFLNTTNPHTARFNEAAAGGGVLGNRSNGSLLGIDSIPNWSSYFYYPGVDSNGFPVFTWQYTMVGHAPFGQGEEGDWEGEKTRIGAPIVPVNLDLRNFDGSPRFINGHRMYVDATQFVAPVLSSPIFSKAFYDSSSTPTQYTDAVQRAEFYGNVDDEWHTLLRPRVETTRTLVLIRGTYRFSLNSDGTCCRFVLIDANTFGNALFPATSTDTTSIIGAAENAGDVTTRDISTFLFPNAYLYVGTPNNCCILGYHSYDLEPGTALNGWREKRYVMNYSSWISPGLFGSFTDITALSHELSETFNDPFVNNATPWWLSPNGNCQNNLEDGDVIEGLPNSVFPMALNGATWHPQNEALVQWFAGATPSSAIHGAYSYPDTSVLATASVSQTAGCTAPLPPFTQQASKFPAK